ncbi:hypothetical protein [Kitasatospora sp. NPDC088351]|uniref:hypothetical protein n=1 Tax=Kitasatospora sp. NPDC088351 TaxID=3155180 RepID=UPI0034282C92
MGGGSVLMGLLSALGFGSTKSASSSGATTRTSGMSSGGWHAHDPAAAQRHHRMSQVSLPAAETDSASRCELSPKSDPEHVNAKFWRD